MSQTRPCVECHGPDFGQLYILVYPSLAPESSSPRRTREPDSYVYGHLYNDLWAKKNSTCLPTQSHTHQTRGSVFTNSTSQQQSSVGNTVGYFLSLASVSISYFLPIPACLIQNTTQGLLGNFVVFRHVQLTNQDASWTEREVT
jgi:hypothetical protein